MGDPQAANAQVREASSFPAIPWGWYYACTLNDLKRGPRPIVVGDQDFVAFRGGNDSVAVLSRSCVHLGADLSLGRVVGSALQCPFHEWEFGADGRCVRIPAATTIPAFARQASFPAVVRGGHVFFSNRSTPAFDCPFFDGIDANDLIPARPFVLDARLPWYLVAANGFDLQHFRTAHDRTLLHEPVITQPHPSARRIRAQFSVSGNGIRDRLTRAFSGPEVTMTITSWGGTCVLVSAEFRRTTSYGMVWVCPTSPASVRLHTIVWVPRSRSRLGRLLFDPADAAVRRSFIRAFVRSDHQRSAGIRYNRASMIEADATLVAYMDWLQAAVRGNGSVACQLRRPI